MDTSEIVQRSLLTILKKNFGPETRGLEIQGGNYSIGIDYDGIMVKSYCHEQMIDFISTRVGLPELVLELNIGPILKHPSTSISPNGHPDDCTYVSLRKQLVVEETSHERFSDFLSKWPAYMDHLRLNINSLLPPIFCMIRITRAKAPEFRRYYVLKAYPFPYYAKIIDLVLFCNDKQVFYSNDSKLRLRVPQRKQQDLSARSLNFDSDVHFLSNTTNIPRAIRDKFLETIKDDLDFLGFLGIANFFVEFIVIPVDPEFRNRELDVPLQRRKTMLARHDHPVDIWDDDITICDFNECVGKKTLVPAAAFAIEQGAVELFVTFSGLIRGSNSSTTQRKRFFSKSNDAKRYSSKVYNILEELIV